MARKVPQDRRAVKLTDAERDQFALWLDNELRGAIQARNAFTQDGGYIDYWHRMYEQAERTGSRPWPDAADLASPLPTEKVDALRARLSSVIFGQDTICVAEAWGVPTERVQKVEAFHQWKAEDERLQSYVSKAIHTALIEGNGILEVHERATLKKSRSEMLAKPLLNADFAPILREDGDPEVERDESGRIVPWSGDEAEPYVTINQQSIEWTARGPQYRVLSLKDFLFLPAQAPDRADVWGYAKRCFIRLPDLKQRVQQGLYNAEAVDRLGTDGERDQRAEHTRQGITIAEQQHGTAEKEIWEVHLLHDIDGDDVEEWLIATYSLKNQQLLRLAYDDLEQVRFVDFCPYPRPTSVYGYSFVGHKLWTIAEEHTALRNMKADRQALALNAPLKRLSTSIWHPDEQPFGPGAVIDLRTMQDIEQLQIADVPASTIESERTTLGMAERVSGLGDTAVSGIQPDVRRTATEHNYAAQGSFVRIDEAVRWCQEALEDLYLLRHRLWQRALESEESGLVAPERIMRGLEMRGLEMPEGPLKFTAGDLMGPFRFKPRGSTETADKRALRADQAEMTQALMAIAQMFPGVGQTLAQNSAAGFELLKMVLRLYNAPNPQLFLQQPAVSAPPGVMPAPGQPGAGDPQAEQLNAILGSLTGGRARLVPSETVQ